MESVMHLYKVTTVVMQLFEKKLLENLFSSYIFGPSLYAFVTILLKMCKEKT